MQLYDYFEQHTGTGILATADSNGNVHAAIYAQPHFSAEDELVFMMNDRLAHANLQSNLHAPYSFIESGEGYSDKRLYLTKSNGEEDSELIDGILRRRCGICDESKYEAKYVAYFHIDKVLPLIGSGD